MNVWWVQSNYSATTNAMSQYLSRRVIATLPVGLPLLAETGEPWLVACDQSKTCSPNSLQDLARVGHFIPGSSPLVYTESAGDRWAVATKHVRKSVVQVASQLPRDACDMLWSWPVTVNYLSNYQCSEPGTQQRTSPDSPSQFAPTCSEWRALVRCLKKLQVQFSIFTTKSSLRVHFSQ